MSHKQLPRKKEFPDLASVARAHTKTCIKVLAGIVMQKTAPTAARVSAAGMLLDRGWGKAPQAVTVDGQAAIKVVIRHILEGADGEAIDAEAPQQLLNGIKTIEGELKEPELEGGKSE